MEKMNEGWMELFVIFLLISVSLGDEWIIQFNITSRRIWTPKNDGLRGKNILMAYSWLQPQWFHKRNSSWKFSVNNVIMCIQSSGQQSRLQNFLRLLKWRDKICSSIRHLWDSYALKFQLFHFGRQSFGSLLVCRSDGVIPCFCIVWVVCKMQVK